MDGVAACRNAPDTSGMIIGRCFGVVGRCCGVVGVCLVFFFLRFPSFLSVSSFNFLDYLCSEINTVLFQ